MEGEPRAHFQAFKGHSLHTQILMPLVKYKEDYQKHSKLKLKVFNRVEIATHPTTWFVISYCLIF